MMNYLWPEASMFYRGGRLVSTVYTYASAYNNASRYNNLLIAETFVCCLFLTSAIYESLIANLLSILSKIS